MTGGTRTDLGSLSNSVLASLRPARASTDFQAFFLMLAFHMLLCWCVDSNKNVSKGNLVRSSCYCPLHSPSKAAYRETHLLIGTM
jgi:hypothetical protein